MIGGLSIADDVIWCNGNSAISGLSSSVTNQLEAAGGLLLYQGDVKNQEL